MQMDGAGSEKFNRFLDTVQEINNGIEEAGRIYIEYTAAHDYLVSRGAEYKQLVKEQAEITEAFNTQVLDVTKQIEQLLEKSKSSLTNQKQHHIEGLTERTNRIIKAFSAEKLKRLSKEHERLREQYLIANPEATSEELEKIASGPAGKELIKNTFGSSDRKAMQIEDALEKNKNITKLLEDIKELEILSRQLQNTLTISGTYLKPIQNASYLSIKRTEGLNQNIESMTVKRRRRKGLKLLSLLLLFTIGLIVVGYTTKIFKLFK
ncbi:hypothetical protein NEAUS06_1882 [Nematocida ausubeli]|nr:hypothetical protein NEAUS06_1882 [Nematocida ausubeli]